MHVAEKRRRREGACRFVSVALLALTTPAAFHIAGIGGGARHAHLAHGPKEVRRKVWRCAPFLLFPLLMFAHCRDRTYHCGHLPGNFPVQGAIITWVGVSFLQASQSSMI